MKLQKNQLIVLALLVLVIAAFGYIAYDKYTSTVQAQQFGILQQGAQLGYQQAVLQLIQQASQCKPVPVTYGNVTINVVAVECFQKTQ